MIIKERSCVRNFFLRSRAASVNDVANSFVMRVM